MKLRISLIKLTSTVAGTGLISPHIKVKMQRNFVFHNNLLSFIATFAFQMETGHSGSPADYPPRFILKDFTRQYSERQYVDETSMFYLSSDSC